MTKISSRKIPYQIGFFETNPGFGGGNIYQKMIIQTLAQKYILKSYNVFPKKFPKLIRPQILMKILRQNRKKTSIDLWIRNILGVIGMKYSQKMAKNIAVFFHRDYENIPNKLVSNILDYYFWKNIRKCDKVVVISQYWKNFLESQGIKNVDVIYCGFDIPAFTFSQEELENFQKKYGLKNKTIIYLGNCQEAKGVREAYSHLKNTPYYLVTSGKPQIKLPIPNLELNYRDYLLLLKSSSVVLTMSKFLEGWNITAHEAMLCKTPVIGSGKGGMRELLEGGRQIICTDFSELAEQIEYALKSKEELGSHGYEFASKYTLEMFESKWLNLVDHILNRNKLK